MSPNSLLIFLLSSLLLSHVFLAVLLKNLERRFNIHREEYYTEKYSVVRRLRDLESKKR